MPASEVSGETTVHFCSSGVISPLDPPRTVHSRTVQNRPSAVHFRSFTLHFRPFPFTSPCLAPATPLAGLARAASRQPPASVRAAAATAKGAAVSNPGGCHAERSRSISHWASASHEGSPRDFSATLEMTGKALRSLQMTGEAAAACGGPLPLVVSLSDCARALVLHSPPPYDRRPPPCANACAPRPHPDCARARRLRLGPADRRCRTDWRAPHPHAARDTYANSVADGKRSPSTYRDAYTSRVANAHPHANPNSRAIPVDRVPAWDMARRGTGRPRCLRGHAAIGNMRVGAPQQARCQQRGRALRGLDHRPHDRWYPPHRRRVPSVRGLRLVDGQTAPDTHAHAWTDRHADAVPRSCGLPRTTAVHHAEQRRLSHMRTATRW